VPFTYTPSDAIALVRKFIHDIPVTAVDSQVVDQISSIIYRAYPWRWTLNQISPSISLVDDTQKYDSPTNIMRLFRARLQRTDTTRNQFVELTPTSFLPETTDKLNWEAIQFITLEEATGQLWLDYRPNITGSMAVQIDGEFQVTPTKITDSNLGVNYWSPDHYFDVHVEGIKWKFYQLADDPRAGTVQIVNHNKIYTGQLGIFHDALLDMRAQEDVGDALSFEFPDDPLGAVRDTSDSFSRF